MIADSKNKKGISIYAKVSLLLLLIVATIAFVYLYHVGGPSWDYIVHYLNGRTLSNPQLYNSRNVLLTVGTLQAKTAYYEAYRAPVAVFIFWILSLVNSKPLFLYAIVLWAIFLVAIYKFHKDVKLDTLITYAAMLSPYIIAITFFLSSEEILSIIFAMISLGLIIREEPLAGATLGIASLAKYPSLILLPTIVLLRKPKKILKGLIFEAVAMLPWFFFNYILTGRPLISIIQSYTIVLGTAAAAPIYLETLIIVFSLPLIFAILYLLIFAKMKLSKKKFETPFSLKKLDNTKIAIGAFFGLALIQWLLVVWHHDFIAQSRYAYLIGFMCLVVFAYLFSEMQKSFKLTKYLVCAVSVLSLLVFILGTSWSVQMASQFNPNSNQSTFLSAQKALDSLGYGNCRIISNAWPYMRYFGINAYMPYYLNSTTQEYPILIFSNVGVNTTGLLSNINQTRTVYSGQNFSILVPYNYKCYTN